MKGERIYKSLNLVDEAYIEESAPVIKAGGKGVWLKWVAVAACICLVMTSMWPHSLWINRLCLLVRRKLQINRAGGIYEKSDSYLPCFVMNVVAGGTPDNNST